MARADIRISCTPLGLETHTAELVEWLDIGTAPKGAELIPSHTLTVELILLVEGALIKIRVSPSVERPWYSWLSWDKLSI